MTRGRTPAAISPIWLDNGTIRLGLAPDLGGRLLSLQLQGVEFLYRASDLVNDELVYTGDREPRAARTLQDWVNVGGDKTWPAPQGWELPTQWPGPPDAVLDAGPYTPAAEELDGAKAVTVSSGVEPRTGLRIQRRLVLPATGTRLRLELSLENASAAPVTWAIWNVTQLRVPSEQGPDDGVLVGVPPRDLDVVKVVEGTGVPRVQRLAERVASVPAQRVVGKVGFPNATGWMAYVGPAGTMSWSFPVEADLEYPDGGSRVEVWLEHPLDVPIAHLGGLRPAEAIVECEVLGPLRTLHPGDRTTLPLTIGVSAARGPVTNVVDTALVHEPFHLISGPEGHVVAGALSPLRDGEVVHLAPDGAVSAMGRVRAGVHERLRAAVPTARPGAEIVLKEPGTARATSLGKLP